MFSIAFAQGNGGAAPANTPPQAIRTGVVDMYVLMRAHPKLNADMKELRDRQQLIVNQLMAAEKVLMEDAKTMQGSGYKPGTDEFNQVNDALEKRAAALSTDKNKAQRELGLQDIKIKYAAFKSIRDEIQAVSVASGFAVVVDVRGTDPDLDDLSNAEMEVGQTVVWNAPSVNMTTAIVNRLNQKFQQFPAAAKVDNGKVVFLNTNQNEGGGSGPSIPQQPAPGARQQQPVAQPGSGNVGRQ